MISKPLPLPRQKALWHCILGCYDKALEEETAIKPDWGPLPGVQAAAAYRNWLHHFIKIWDVKFAVELGTDNGTTCCFMASGNPNCKVVTIEIDHRDDAAGYISHYPNAEYWHNTESVGAARRVVRAAKPHGGIGMCYFDTTHTYPQTTHEKNNYLRFLTADGVGCVDDIMLHKGMRKFWTEVEEFKLIVNKLHTQHLGSTAEDGTYLPEGTGWGIIIPGIKRARWQLESDPRVSVDKTYGGLRLD